VKTLEGEKIKRLLAEFVDIILKKKQILDPHGRLPNDYNYFHGT
jgi:hypothetical protein